MRAGAGSYAAVKRPVCGFPGPGLWDPRGVDEQPPTVRSRVLDAGISPERLAGHFERGTVQLDGQTVTDLDTPAPRGTRIVFAGS